MLHVQSTHHYIRLALEKLNFKNVFLTKLLIEFSIVPLSYQKFVRTTYQSTLTFAEHIYISTLYAENCPVLRE